MTLNSVDKLVVGSLEYFITKNRFFGEMRLFWNSAHPFWGILILKWWSLYSDACEICWKDMTIRSATTWSWIDDVLPFVVMLMITCLDMSLLTIVKAAMNDGMGSIIYIVYHDALGTLILLLFFIIHIFRFANKIHVFFIILYFIWLEESKPIIMGALVQKHWASSTYFPSSFQILYPWPFRVKAATYCEFQMFKGV